MRKLRYCALALAIVCTAIPSANGAEIFICNDGRTIELTAANRAKFKDDPCIAEWFKGQKEAAAAEQTKAKEPPNKMMGIPAYCKKPMDCPHLW